MDIFELASSVLLCKHACVCIHMCLHVYVCVWAGERLEKSSLETISFEGEKLKHRARQSKPLCWLPLNMSICFLRQATVTKIGSVSGMLDHMLKLLHGLKNHNSILFIKVLFPSTHKHCLWLQVLYLWKKLRQFEKAPWVLTNNLHSSCSFSSVSFHWVLTKIQQNREGKKYYIHFIEEKLKLK